MFINSGFVLKNTWSKEEKVIFSLQPYYMPITFCHNGDIQFQRQSEKETEHEKDGERNRKREREKEREGRERMRG